MSSSLIRHQIFPGTTIIDTTIIAAAITIIKITATTQHTQHLTHFFINQREDFFAALRTPTSIRNLAGNAQRDFPE